MNDNEPKNEMLGKDNLNSDGQQFYQYQFQYLCYLLIYLL